MSHLGHLTLHQTDPLVLLTQSCAASQLTPFSGAPLHCLQNTASSPRWLPTFERNKFTKHVPGAAHSGPAGSRMRGSWSASPRAHTLTWDINQRHRQAAQEPALRGTRASDIARAWWPGDKARPGEPEQVSQRKHTGAVCWSGPPGSTPRRSWKHKRLIGGSVCERQWGGRGRLQNRRQVC